MRSTLWRSAALVILVVCVAAWALLEAESDGRAMGGRAEGEGRASRPLVACKRCGLLEQFRRCQPSAAPATTCTLPLSSLLPTQIAVGPLAQHSVKRRLREQQSTGALEDILTEVQVPVLLGEGRAYALGGAEWISALMEEAKEQEKEWEVLVLVVANYDRVTGAVTGGEERAQKQENHRHAREQATEKESEEESAKSAKDFLSLRSGSEGFWFWVLVKGDDTVAAEVLLPRLELLSEVALKDTRGLGPFDPHELPATFLDLHADPYADIAAAAIDEHHISPPRKSGGAGHRPLPPPRDLILLWADYFRSKIPFPAQPDRGALYEWCTLRPYDSDCWPNAFNLEQWEDSVASAAAAAAHEAEARHLPGYMQQ